MATILLAALYFKGVAGEAGTLGGKGLEAGAAKGINDAVGRLLGK